jgi:hypothetical protein
MSATLTTVVESRDTVALGRLLPFNLNPAHLLRRVHQDLFQLFTHRKAVAADLDGANNVHSTWMPLTHDAVTFVQNDGNGVAKQRTVVRGDSRNAHQPP